MEEREDGSIPSFQDKLLTFARNNFLIVGLLSVGLILIVVGLMQMMGGKEAAVKFESGEEVAGSSTSKIMVDVAGEVENPGVYSLDSGARIQDALIAAGGLTPDADRELIERSVNLAQIVTDGTKIYVPAVGESAEQNSVVSAGSNLVSGGSNFVSAGESQGGLISINSATGAILEELPGIGPVTAQKIIDNRPYGSVQELLDKKAVGSATYEKIKDLVSL